MSPEHSDEKQANTARGAEPPAPALPAVPDAVFSTLLAQAKSPDIIGQLIHQILVKSKYEDIETVVSRLKESGFYSTSPQRFFLRAAEIALELDHAEAMAAVYQALRNVLCPDPPRNLINFSGWGDVKDGDLLRLRDGKTVLQVVQSRGLEGSIPDLERIEGDYQFGTEEFLKDSAAVLSQILVVERPSIETCLEHARKHADILSYYSLARLDVLLMLSSAASESGMPRDVRAESLQVFLDGLHGKHSLSMATPARVRYPLILVQLAVNHPQAVTEVGARKIYQAVVNWANPDENNPYRDPQSHESWFAEFSSRVLNHPSFLKLQALMDSSK